MISNQNQSEALMSESHHGSSQTVRSQQYQHKYQFTSLDSNLHHPHSVATDRYQHQWKTVNDQSCQHATSADAEGSSRSLLASASLKSGSLDSSDSHFDDLSSVHSSNITLNTNHYYWTVGRGQQMMNILKCLNKHDIAVGKSERTHSNESDSRERPNMSRWNHHDADYRHEDSQQASLWHHGSSFSGMNGSPCSSLQPGMILEGIPDETRKPVLQHSNQITTSINEHLSEVLASSKIESGTSLVNTANRRADIRQRKMTYIKGEYVHFKTDQTHEIVEVRNQVAKNIKQESCAKIVCSFLNSGSGGVIYYGITKNHEVVGLYLDRDERDSLQLGVAKVMKMLTPVVPSTLCRIEFVPVFDRRGCQISDCFILEIHIESPGAGMYSIDANGVYFRYKDKIFPATYQDVNKKAVLDEEKHYLSVIQYLQAAINDAQKKLGASDTHRHI